MKPMTIRSVVRSDKGLVREINEDSVGVLSEQGLVVLTDGMGGHCSGEVASRLAVAAITRLISSHPTASPQLRSNLPTTLFSKRSVRTRRSMAWQRRLWLVDSTTGLLSMPMWEIHASISGGTHGCGSSRGTIQ